MSAFARAVAVGRGALLAALLSATTIPLPEPGRPMAQSPLQAQSRLEVGAHLSAGALMARDGLANAPLLESSTNVLHFAEFTPAVSVGVGLEFGLVDVPARLRLTATRSLDRNQVGVWGCAPDASGNPLPCPSILISVPTDVGASAAAADLVGVVEAGPLEINPLLGVGWMRYSYDWDPAPVGSFSLDPGKARVDSAILHWGLGVGVPMGGVRFAFEYSAYHSRANPARPKLTRSATLGVTVPMQRRAR